MDFELVINSLCLEVTRRCNMECAHCLRGKAQNIDMPYEYVDRIIEMSSQINSIVFTGGEPTLNLPLIEYTFSALLKKYKYLPPFFVATNGKLYQRELALTLMDAYFDVEEKEMCGVSISVDRYHEKVDHTRNYLRLLPFYDSGKEHSDGASDNWVLNIGAANQNGVGMQTPYDPHTGRFVIEKGAFGSKPWLQVDTIAITATGDVLNACDYAYDDTEGLYVCKLSELEDHLTQEMMKEKEE